MAWVVCQDADGFLRQCRRVLTEQPSLHNVAWSAVGRAQRATSVTAKPMFLTLNTDDGDIVHAFTESNNEHLVLSAMSSAAAESLAVFLYQKAMSFRGLEGPPPAAKAFAIQWSRMTQAKYKIEMRQGIYELICVHLPDSNGGCMIPATDVHRPQLQRFIQGFWHDCFPDQTITAKNIQSSAQRFIEHKRAFLWQDAQGRCVSMAAIVRESPLTSSISGVYTPPAYRGLGHAARVVANLSQAQLDAGKSACNLFTDLDNATSNGVYTRIGYALT